MDTSDRLIKAGVPGSTQACYSPYGPLRCDCPSGHPGDHDYADVEDCDECSGTRWPLSEHERWCSLREIDEYCEPDSPPAPPALTLWSQQALADLVIAT